MYCVTYPHILLRSILFSAFGPSIRARDENIIIPNPPRSQVVVHKVLCNVPVHLELLRPEPGSSAEYVPDDEYLICTCGKVSRCSRSDRGHTSVFCGVLCKSCNTACHVCLALSPTKRSTMSARRRQLCIIPLSRPPRRLPRGNERYPQLHKLNGSQSCLPLFAASQKRLRGRSTLVGCQLYVVHVESHYSLSPGI